MAEARTPRTEKAVPNTFKTLEYLNRAFQEVTRGMPLAQKIRWVDPSDREVEGQHHYEWQVNMAHFVNEIINSPQYLTPKLVADCNKMIDDIKVHRRS